MNTPKSRSLLPRSNMRRASSVRQLSDVADVEESADRKSASHQPTSVVYITKKLLREMGPKRSNSELELDLSSRRLRDRGRIRTIEQLDTFSQITVLNLSGNRIDRIAGLSRLHQLKMLNLSGNQIRRIEALQSQQRLTHLNLSCNLIETIPKELPPSLELFNLSFNRISLKRDVLRMGVVLKCLENLDMTGNPVDGDENSRGRREFFVFHLPSVQVLNEKPITEEERQTAKERLQSAALADLQKQLIDQDELFKKSQLDCQSLRTSLDSANQLSRTLQMDKDDLLRQIGQTSKELEETKRQLREITKEKMQLVGNYYTRNMDNELMNLDRRFQDLEKLRLDDLQSTSSSQDDTSVDAAYLGHAMYHPNESYSEELVPMSRPAKRAAAKKPASVMETQLAQPSSQSSGPAHLPDHHSADQLEELWRKMAEKDGQLARLQSAIKELLQRLGRPMDDDDRSQMQSELDEKRRRISELEDQLRTKQLLLEEAVDANDSDDSFIQQLNDVTPTDDIHNDLLELRKKISEESDGLQLLEQQLFTGKKVAGVGRQSVTISSGTDAMAVSVFNQSTQSDQLLTSTPSSSKPTPLQVGPADYSVSDLEGENAQLRDRLEAANAQVDQPKEDNPQRLLTELADGDNFQSQQHHSRPLEKELLPMVNLDSQTVSPRSDLTDASVQTLRKKLTQLYLELGSSKQALIDRELDTRRVLSGPVYHLHVNSYQQSDRADRLFALDCNLEDLLAEVESSYRQQMAELHRRLLEQTQQINEMRAHLTNGAVEPQVPGAATWKRSAKARPATAINFEDISLLSSDDADFDIADHSLSFGAENGAVQLSSKPAVVSVAVQYDADPDLFGTVSRSVCIQTSEMDNPGKGGADDSERLLFQKEIELRRLRSDLDKLRLENNEQVNLIRRDADAEVGRLKQKLREADSETALVREDVAHLKALLEKEREQAFLSSQGSSAPTTARSQLRNDAADNDQTAAQREQLDRLLASKDKLIAEKERELVALQSEVDSLRTEIESYKLAADKERSRAEDLASALEESDRKLSRLEKDLEAAAHQSTELKDLVRQLEEQKSASIRESEAKVQRIAMLEHQIAEQDRLAAVTNTDRNGRSAYEVELQIAKDQLHSQLETLAIQLKQSEMENQELREHVADLGRKLDANENSKAIQTNAAGGSTSRSAAAASETQPDLIYKLEEETRKQQSLQSYVNDLQQQLNESRQTNQRLKMEIREASDSQKRLFYDEAAAQTVSPSQLRHHQPLQHSSAVRSSPERPRNLPKWPQLAEMAATSTVIPSRSTEDFVGLEHDWQTSAGYLPGRVHDDSLIGASPQLARRLLFNAHTPATSFDRADRMQPQPQPQLQSQSQWQPTSNGLPLTDSAACASCGSPLVSDPTDLALTYELPDGRSASADMAAEHCHRHRDQDVLFCNIPTHRDRKQVSVKSGRTSKSEQRRSSQPSALKRSPKKRRRPIDHEDLPASDEMFAIDLSLLVDNSQTELTANFAQDLAAYRNLLKQVDRLQLESDRLEKTLNKERDELDGVKRTIYEKRSERDGLLVECEQVAADLQSQRNNLQVAKENFEQLKRATQDLSLVKAQIESAQSHLGQLHEEEAEATSNLRSAEQKVARLQQELDVRQALLDETRTKCNKEKELSQENQQRLFDVRSELLAAESECRERRKSLETLEGSLARKRRDFEQLEKTYDEERQRFQAEVSRLRDDVDGRKQDLDETRHEIDLLNSQKSTMQDELHDLSTLFDQLKRQLTEERALLEQVRELVSSEKSRLINMQLEGQQSKKVLDDLASERDRLLAEISSLKDALLGAQEQKLRLAGEIDAMKLDTQRKQAELKDAEARADKAAARENSSQLELSRLQKDRQSVIDELQQLRLNLQNAETEVAKKRETIEALQHSETSLRQKVRQLDDEARTKLSELEQYSTKMEENESYLRKAEDKVRCAKEEKKSCEAEIRSLLEKTVSARRDAEELGATIDSEAEKRDRLREAVAEKQAELKRCTKRLEKLQQSINERRAQFDSLHKEKQSELDRLTAELRERETRLETLQTRESKAHTMIREAENKLSETQRRTLEVEERDRKLTQQEQSLRRTVEDLERSKAESVDRVSSLERQLAELRASSENARADWQAREQTLNGNLAILETDYAELKRCLDTAQAELDSLRTENSNQVANLSMIAEDYMCRTNRLVYQLQEMQQQLHSAEHRSNSERDGRILDAIQRMQSELRDELSKSKRSSPSIHSSTPRSATSPDSDTARSNSENVLPVRTRSVCVGVNDRRDAKVIAQLQRQVQLLQDTRVLEQYAQLSASSTPWRSTLTTSVGGIALNGRSSPAETTVNSGPTDGLANSSQRSELRLRLGAQHDQFRRQLKEQMAEHVDQLAQQRLLSEKRLNHLKNKLNSLENVISTPTNAAAPLPVVTTSHHRVRNTPSSQQAAGDAS